MAGARCGRCARAPAQRRSQSVIGTLMADASSRRSGRPQALLRSLRSPFRFWTFCAPTRRQARQMISLNCAVDGCWRPGSTTHACYAGDRNTGPVTTARKRAERPCCGRLRAAYASRMRSVLGVPHAGFHTVAETSGVGVAAEPAAGWHRARACRSAVIQPRRFGAPALRVPLARARTPLPGGNPAAGACRGLHAGVRLLPGAGR